MLHINKKKTRQKQININDGKISDEENTLKTKTIHYMYKKALASRKAYVSHQHN